MLPIVQFFVLIRIAALRKDAFERPFYAKQLTISIGVW
jgi:hypothetical protein